MIHISVIITVDGVDYQDGFNLASLDAALPAAHDLAIKIQRKIEANDG